MTKLGLLLVVLVVCFSLQTFAKVKPGQKQTQLEWWQEGIVYQIYPRSHQDSDADGIGDLVGIQSKLDELVQLGINAVWISPIYKSPMKDFGYDISDFRDIEPTFGNLTQFQSLANAMRERGLKLIMDFVPNHSSNEHEWFIKSEKKIEPYTNYYVWKDPKAFDADGKPVVPNNWVSLFGGSMWEWSPVRQQFYLHQFAKEQPDLNCENPRVLYELLAALKFWLDMGVDGFRVDAVPHMFEDMLFPDEKPNPDAEDLTEVEYGYWLHEHTYNRPEVLETLADMRKLMDTYTKADGHVRVMMVEATVPELENLFKYYGTPEKPIAHFPFNFEFINRIKAPLNANDLKAMLTEWFEKLPEGAWSNWLVGNHDNSRVSKRFGTQAVDALNMIVILLPGNAVTYYGEEIGMEDRPLTWAETVDPAGCNAGQDKYEQYSRDPCRTPMQWNDQLNAGFSTSANTWLPVHTNYRTLNVLAQKAAAESHWKVYQKLSLLRKTDAWRFGELEFESMNSGTVFGFTRILEDGTGFLVLMNFGNTLQNVAAKVSFPSIPTLGTVAVRSVGFTPATTNVGSSIATNTIAVGATSSLVLTF